MRIHNKEMKNKAKNHEENYENLDTSKVIKDNSLGIEFPFYTMRDQEYSKFMVLLMQSLEVRKIRKGEHFITELDECPEILFVMEGKYDVGY